MRDPGAPRRNPLFAVGGEGKDSESEAPQPEICAACPVGTAGALFGALGDASPEAIEHLLLAGKEILAAVRVVLEAAEQAIEQSTAEPEGDPDPDAASADQARGRRGRLRKIDLA